MKLQRSLALSMLAAALAVTYGCGKKEEPKKEEPKKAEAPAAAPAAPEAVVKIGHAGPLTEMVLLGCLAVRSGKPFNVDPNSGAISGVDLPTEWVKPVYRKGWSY